MGNEIRLRGSRLNSNGKSRFVEVKTTTMGKYFPFFVTSNEVRCSESTADRYHLYRLFRFTHQPRLHVLYGALSDLRRLEPVSYRATVAGKGMYEMPDKCPFCEPDARRIWFEDDIGVVLWDAFPVGNRCAPNTAQ